MLNNRTVFIEQMSKISDVIKIDFLSIEVIIIITLQLII